MTKKTNRGPRALEEKMDAVKVQEEEDKKRPRTAVADIMNGKEK